jgi:hypothetical protein
MKKAQIGSWHKKAKISWDSWKNRLHAFGWYNCPFSWQGLQKGHTGECSVINEAMADYDLGIWEAFF